MNNNSLVRFSNLVFVPLVFVFHSCTTPGPSGLFGKKSPHDAYSEKIKNAGLNETALGRLWFSAARQSLASPISVDLPYSEAGYFAAEEPKAVGLIFHGRRGEKLTINLSRKPALDFAVYLDLWEKENTADSIPKFLISGDTSTATIQYDIEKESNYVLRLQPELLKGGEYLLSITTGPSLAFPVAPAAKSRIGSFWGAARDAGGRTHEGVDIFAPRGTALVAAANGIVTRVEENKLGGKVIFLTPDNKDYTLYYAHLDKQIAEPGQRVKVGDTVGLVGNTGNAITTVPHLHFGIYGYGGAIDPLPFINPVIKTPEKITSRATNINRWVRNSKTVKLFSRPAATDFALLLEANTFLKVEAATGDWYKVSLPGGEKGFVASNQTVSLSTPIKKVTMKSAQPLLDEPNELAAKKRTLSPGSAIGVLATYKDFYFILQDEDKGWLPKKAL